MELTKNTSVDPAKMIGKNYIEAVNAKFPNTILDEVLRCGFLNVWRKQLFKSSAMAFILSA